jgi:hypothetical protein
VQVDSQVELGMVVGAMDHDRRRPFGQVAVVADLAAGIASRLDGAQQSPLERFARCRLVARGNGLDDLRSGQHVAHRDIALAHLVSRPAAGLGATIGRRAAFAIDDGDLAVVTVGVVGPEFVDHPGRGEALGQQVERQGVVALVDEGLGHRRADIAAQAVAIEADTDRISRDADADLAALWAASQKSESHEHSPHAARTSMRLSYGITHAQSMPNQRGLFRPSVQDGVLRDVESSAAPKLSLCDHTRRCPIPWGK